jgi:hypothetical protein
LGNGGHIQTLKIATQPDVRRQFQKFSRYHPDPKITFADIDQLMWRVGTSRLLTMPYGLEVHGLLKGSLASTALLPQSGNQLGDTWVVGHTPWVWIVAPGWSQPLWVDP